MILQNYVFIIKMNPKYSEVLITHKNALPDEIPQYPAQIIQKAFEEIAACQAELRQLKKQQQEKADLPEDDRVFIRGKMVVKVDTIYRLKRFLLILNENRLNRVQRQFWQFGGEIKKQEINHLSEKQKNFLLEYKSLANDYMENTDLELTMDLSPPLDSLVQIKVIKDCGEIMELSELGYRFEKNSVHLIKRRLVEKLIQRGDVVIIG